MNTNGNAYTVIYTTIVVTLVAAILAFVAMTLKPKQDANIKAETISQMLTEEEQAVFRHGRNAKPKSVPKSSSPTEYALATA